MSTAAKQVYDSIPPTTDLNYWFVKSSELKTQVFSPIDKELHRSLILKEREQRQAKAYKPLPAPWRRTIHGKPIPR